MGAYSSCSACTDEPPEEERRIDPSIDGMAVTFSQMKKAINEKARGEFLPEMSDRQLRERWNKLQKALAYQTMSPLDENCEVQPIEDAMDVFNDESALADIIADSILPLEAQECMLKATDEDWGDHIVPQILSQERLDKFNEENYMKLIIGAVRSRIESDFGVEAERRKALDSLDNPSQGKKGTPFAFCVSDPEMNDCPLMFVSHGFVTQTGYSKEFAEGRSCRFLQPTAAPLNNAVNLKERKLMRIFASEGVKPVGTKIINLLLNETYEGKRFWNLLQMEFIEVSGKSYIFAVQTVINAHMPKILQKRIQQKSTILKVVDSSKKYLKQLNHLRDQIHHSRSSFSELRTFVTTELEKMKPTSGQSAGGDKRRS